jgi:hypothetical protein
MGVTFAAVGAFAVDPQPPGTLLGLTALLIASTFADRFPVPVEGVDTGGVSLSFVFGVAAIVLFGWAAGLLVVFLAPALTQLLERRPPVRIAYNVSVLALAATCAGAVSALFDGNGPTGVLAHVSAVAFVQYAINLVLITAVVAVSSRRSLLSLAQSNIRWTVVPFSLMASSGSARPSCPSHSSGRCLRFSSTSGRSCAPCTRCGSPSPIRSRAWATIGTSTNGSSGS